MAGLMNSSALTPPGMPMGDGVRPETEGPQEDVVGDDEEGEQATPEEQAQYEAFVKDGFKLIYEGGEARQSILDMLDEDPADLIDVLGDVKDLKDVTPSVTLAATAVIVVLELVRRAGPNKPADDIILHGGKAILEDLAHLATVSGVHDYSQDEIDQAWLMGQDLYRETATQEGLLDPAALKSQFDEIVTADKDGRLGDVLPALAKAQVRAPEGEAPAEPQQEMMG
jgi:hypothetical protein